jgi:hypothetical protein
MYLNDKSWSKSCCEKQLVLIAFPDGCRDVQ